MGIFRPLALRHPGLWAYHFGVNALLSKPGAGAARWTLYILCLLPAFAHAQTVDSLIQSLADPDSNKRTAAEAQLKRMGAEARPALVLSSRNPSPAVASASARILLALPWYRPTDPPQVQELLRNYGSLDEAGRIAIVSQLAQLDGFRGLPALLRLIMEDPSEDVCWKIVTHMTRVAASDMLPVENPKAQPQVRLLNPPDSRPAALTLAARAWIDRDRPKALQLLDRAIKTELRQPSFDDGNLDFAFDELVLDAVGSKKYDEAANLRRIQTNRLGVTRDSYPTPVYQLFVLHARYGPLLGFENDVVRYEPFLGHPQMMYMVSQVYDRAGRGIEALACQQAAGAASLTPDSHYDVAGFLARNGWSDLARGEYHVLARAEEPYLVEVLHRDVSLGYLTTMASRDDADAIAIEYLQRRRDLIAQPGITWRDGKDRREELIKFYTSEILWRQARIALSKGNMEEANARFDELMALSPSDTDVIQNSYPLLVSLNRRADADKLFGFGYARLRAQLEAAPEAPVWWNDLAWLCARCDQKLDEALELSKRAVAAEPYSISYIDTLAEVYFRNGNAAEAVKLETQALEIEPNDVFMLKQLDRFKAGVK